MIKGETCLGQIALIISGDSSFSRSVARALTERGWTPRLAVTAVAALYMLDRERFDVVLLDDFLPGSGGVPIYMRLLDMSDDERPVLLVWTDLSSADTAPPPRVIYRQRTVTDPREPASAVSAVLEAAGEIGRRSIRVDSVRGGRTRRPWRVWLLAPMLGLLLATAWLVIAQRNNATESIPPQLGGRTPPDASSTIPRQASATSVVIVSTPDPMGTPVVSTTAPTATIVTTTPTSAPATVTLPTPVATLTPAPTPREEATLEQQVARAQTGSGRAPVSVRTSVEALLPYTQVDEERALRIRSSAYNPREGTIAMTGLARVGGVIVPGEMLLKPQVRGGALELSLVKLQCSLCRGSLSQSVRQRVVASLDLADLNRRLSFQKVSVVRNGLLVTAATR